MDVALRLALPLLSPARDPMKKTTLQLTGAGIIALVVACVVVVMVFKEKHLYHCDNTCAARLTVEVFGLILSEDIIESPISGWVRSIHGGPLDYDWGGDINISAGRVSSEIPKTRAYYLNVLWELKDNPGSEDLALRLIKGPKEPDPTLVEKILRLTSDHCP